MEEDKDTPKAPCEHPSWSQERMGMFHTGDFICRACGELLTPGEVKSITEKRRAAREPS